MAGITSAIKTALNKVPLLRAAAQIVACGFGPIACVGAAGVLALASGGSIASAIQAMAMSAFNIGAWTEVGAFLEPLKALGTGGFALVKGAVHGAVGGAMVALEGGRFIDGFVSSSLGAFAGVAAGQSMLADIGGTEGRIVRAMVVGALGGAASELSGGKFANGAVTAAFAHLWNAEGGGRRGRFLLLDLVLGLKKLYDNDLMYGPWRSVQFEGRTVYVRDDLIDPMFVDQKTGLSNMDLMLDGQSPIGPDGNRIHLHHVLMTDKGPLAEVTQTFHQEHSWVLHNLYERPHTSLINRGQFQDFKERYWLWRGKQFE